VISVYILNTLNVQLRDGYLRALARHILGKEHYFNDRHGGVGALALS
jgi:hypothetical protein